ncbi:hypothetical protein HMPREF9072_02266, partial [Capnocytophaga sp. oral taxon 324 str. F0483]
MRELENEKMRELENERINRLVNGINANNTRNNQLCQSLKPKL